MSKFELSDSGGGRFALSGQMSFDTKPRATVKTIVRLDNGTKVPVNYGVVKRESGWMMFDVTIEGISYVRNFRTELNAEIQTKGLRAVINRLNGTQSTASASE